MKNQIKLLVMGMLFLGLSFQSCEKEDVDVVDEVQSDAISLLQTETNREVVTDSRILDRVRELAIDVAKVTRGDFHYPDGRVEERLYIGEDIAMTEKALFSTPSDQGQSRQFRTFNLVSRSNQTIDIIGYTGNDQFGLSNKGRTALQWAVNNYNRISGSNLRFNLTFGTNFGNQDMVVYDNSVNNSGSGGVADFPDNQGRPNKFVQIYNLEGASTNVNEHVITHEIGHSIGFRHSDYYDRQSCGGFSNEGAGSIGAIQLPGTPTRDFDSIMQACFSNTVDGEFSNNDVTALRAMY